MYTVLGLGLLVIVISSNVFAQSYEVTTVVEQGGHGYQDGTVSVAKLVGPHHVALDSKSFCVAAMRWLRCHLRALPSVSTSVNIIHAQIEGNNLPR